MEIKHGRSSVYAIEYHIVFVIKYRKQVITNAIKTDLYNTLQNIAIKHNTYQITDINGEPDHVHLLVQASPTQNIPAMIKQLKGESARLILLQHPELKTSLWGGHFWSPTYFIATVSENTEHQIKNYIQSQGEQK